MEETLGYPPPSPARVIVHTPEPGAGAGQYVAEFVKALEAAGETTVLFCPGNFAYSREVAAGGTQVVCGPPREVGPAPVGRRVVRNLLFAAGSAGKLWQTVRRGDIVHFQFAPRFGLHLPCFAVARARGARVILTVHDPLPHRWFLPYGIRWMETLSWLAGYLLSARLIAHNAVGKRILQRRFYCPEEKIIVIPHGPLSLGSDETRVRDEPGREEPLRLLAFGSLRRNKGLHLAISAVQRFHKSANGRLVTLTIAGCVPNSMERAYWRDCLRQIDSQPSSITVIEREIRDDEIAGLFRSHHAALLPYLDFFSDSGVAMLSLTQRMPIIATSAGGLGELLGEADCGILIEERTPDGVMAAIEKAATASREELRAKGVNGYRLTLDRRSWRTIAQKTAQVYEEVRLSEAKDGGRVVLHTPEPASSAALYLDALTRALTAEGVRLRFVCPSNHLALGAMRSNPLIEVRASQQRGIQRNISLGAKLLANARFALSSFTTLLKAIQQGDIVHLQYMLHLPFGLIFFLAARLKRAHIVFTVHDPMPHKLLFPRTFHRLEMKSIQCAYAWSDILIVHSEAGKRKLATTFGVPREKIRVIVHGPYILTPGPRPCKDTTRLEVLFFGSLRENKAPHLAIGAVKRLAAEGAPIRLTVAGQVVNRKEEAYWRTCRELIDPDCPEIRLIERFVPDDDLTELFSGVHCFVLPYTDFSSDSGVAYMALANAKPIVATRAGGLGWLLDRSCGGVGIDGSTVDDVMVALRAAATLGAAGLEEMGRRGSDWVLTECGWPNVARETQKVYEELSSQFSSAATKLKRPEETVVRGDISC